MAVKIGNLDISAFKVGSADTKVYLGDTLLYPTAPPSFQGKWLATYSGGTTASASCDATSAITENEINLTNLVSVEIGDCVTTIGEGAFIACYSLTSITIPSSVTSIGQSAFYYCTSLTSCTIGSGVTSIGSNAFFNCTSLTSIDIPNSVTSISEYAFFNCTSLTSIDIPNSVTSIGSDAFNRCSGLTSITINATTPPTLANVNAFDNTNNCPIYVPSASVEAYKSASVWSTIRIIRRIYPIP